MNNFIDAMCIHKAYGKLNTWLAKKPGAEMNGAWGYAIVPEEDGKALRALLAWGAKHSQVEERPADDAEEREFLSKPGRFAQIDVPLRRFRFNQRGGFFEVLDFGAELRIICGHSLDQESA